MQICHVLFPPQKTSNTIFPNKKPVKKTFAWDYAKKHYSNWNLSACLSNNKSISRTARFYFILENKVTGGNFFTLAAQLQSSDKSALFVMKDGSLQELTCKKEIILESGAFYLNDYEEIQKTIKNLNSSLKQKCEGYSLSSLDHKIEISIYSCRTANPTHLFTKDELTNAMRVADDRVSNRIVVDVDGNVSVISGNEPTFLYPVRNEMFCPRNNYVGKYAPLMQIDDLYCALLDAWLQYLKTGRFQSVGDYLSINDEDELRKQLKVFYPHYQL